MENGNFVILIAEDDKDIADLIRMYLQSVGYGVLWARDGLEAQQMILSEKPSLGIFDIMMPRMNGLELIQRVRRINNMPIIVLSAKDQDMDKILGLDMGADDYMCKPFNPLELLARVNSNIRRFYHLNDTSKGIITSLHVGELCLDTQTMTLLKNEKEILLTPTEYKILLLLMQNPGKVFTKGQIYETINGEYFLNDENTVMVHISNLRDKVEQDSREPQYIKTIRGLGYKMEKESRLSGQEKKTNA